MVAPPKSGDDRSEIGLHGETPDVSLERDRWGSLLPKTIRGKLLLVFGLIVLAAAISAVIAQRANVLVQQQLAAITEDNLPSLVTAHKVSETMTNIRSVAAAMASADSEPALASRRVLLNKHIEDAKLIVEAVDETSVNRQTANRLTDLVADVDEFATELASTVETRLELDRHLSKSIQALVQEHSKFNLAIAPLVSQKLGFLGTESARVTESTEVSVNRLNEISFNGLIPVLSINVQLAVMKESLLGALAADTEDVLDGAWQEFVRSSSVASRNIEQLQSNAAVTKIIEMERLTAAFRRMMSFGVGEDSLFEKKRIQLGAEGGGAFDEAEALSDLEQAIKEFERQLKLSITLIRGHTVSVGVDLNRQVSDSLTAINEASVDGYGALLKLEALGNRAVGLLSVAPFADALSELQPLQAEFKASEAEVSSVLDRLAGGADISATANQARELIEFGQDTSGVFALRASELRALERVDDLLFQTNALTQRMSSIAAEIVSTARERTDAAAEKVLASLDSSRLTLLIVFGISFATMLGAMAYVNRSLGSRLSAFSNATLALAEGDLRVKLPEPAGRDEISRLMRALSVFRDTAVEMEESNLREIAQTRQRLVDAIGSISEGFSLYDADDRLVVANEHYRKMLYPGIEDVIVPGTTFETIIRNAAERGLIPEAQPNIDAWIADRLAQHRNPSGSYLQKRSDGRWIQIDERRTAEGGTVAVYTDITEQKNYETELLRARDAAEEALADLQKAQARLVQAEKMASLGQLTAGIAHEIKNPLNFVNNFARLSDEMVGELADLLESQIAALDAEKREDAEELLTTVRENLAKITQHGKRADSIVKNMLMHAREGPSERQSVGLNAVVEEALNLAYHGARAEHPGFNIEMDLQLDPEVGEIECYPQDLMRVFLNLISNGMYAADKRRGEAGDGFSPTISLATRTDGDRVEIEVRDNGVGIPAELREQIFLPFFTTKPTGEGTGLGLSLSYDIVVKQHGGELTVESEPGAFTTFHVTLPRQLPETGGEGR